jgi:exodeoxyribonuclease I
MNNQAQATIYWHDYETWGVNPQKDHPCQFGGIRTDMELNIISKPLMIFSQIPNDYLPHPGACLVTGITPQQSLRDGLSEAEFIARIHKEFSQPNTCVAGYNNIRFDDEVTRYTLYRNFYDPYAREWQNGNSRWDIIDLLRACYALRPEGIVWPSKEDGSPSFKLEELTQANGIAHQDAHDAMSDVYATIAVAKLVKEKQPKLFNYLFELRQKHKVAELIDCDSLVPFVHVSSKLPAVNGCCTWMVPICYHPTNKNAVIALNLALDPDALFHLSAAQISDKLYTPSELLEAGEQRLPIKLIHINKCPVIAAAKTLNEDNAARLGIDRTVCLNNLNKIKANAELRQKLVDVFLIDSPIRAQDADYALYSGGFFSNQDRATMERIRVADGRELMNNNWQFSDPRLATLLFRYRARNFPTTLDEQEIQNWQRHRQFRLMDKDSPASIKMQDYVQQLEFLSQEYAQDPDKLALIKALYRYAENL